uniref:Head maturation protease n=1 Tax=Pseudomonas phage RVTF4 TaxID=3236931 RepID=A0AB39CCQ9_9VIRU
MYYTTIDLTKRQRDFSERFQEFWKKHEKHGIYCEFGHPNDATKMFRRVLSCLEDGVAVTLTRHHTVHEEESLRRFRTIDEERVCARLVEPVIHADKIVFQLIPYGPYGEVVRDALEEGRMFIPGARTFTDGYGRHADRVCREVIALDLIPSEMHMDTGEDKCRPFASLS